MRGFLCVWLMIVPSSVGACVVGRYCHVIRRDVMSPTAASASAASAGGGLPID